MEYCLPEIYIRSFIEQMQQHDNYIITYTHEPEFKRWVLTLKYGADSKDICDVEILILDQWVSFTSILMNNFEGENLAYYYDFLSRVSSQLNGFKLGVTTDGEYISLQAEVPFAGFNYEVLLQVIEGFRSFYAQWIIVLLQTANKWSLKFRRKKVGEIDEMMALFGLKDEPREQKTGEIIQFPKVSM